MKFATRPRRQVTAREDFGTPDAADILLEIGLLYRRRGLLIDGVRAFMSGIEPDVAIATLQAVVIELENRSDA